MKKKNCENTELLMSDISKTIENAINSKYGDNIKSINITHSSSFRNSESFMIIGRTIVSDEKFVLNLELSNDEYSDLKLAYNSLTTDKTLIKIFYDLDDFLKEEKVKNDSILNDITHVPCLHYDSYYIITTRNFSLLLNRYNRLYGDKSVCNIKRILKTLMGCLIIVYL